MAGLHLIFFERVSRLASVQLRMKTLRNSVLFYVIVSKILSSSTALQGSNAEAENGIGGYSVGRAYTYRYSSSAQILENTTLALQGEASFIN